MSDSKGRIFVVGIGPGAPDHITPAVKNAIGASEVIVGYKTYLGLVGDLIRGKEVLSSGMRQEVDRCRRAVEAAQTGKTVAVICSGDPGIYAMAGLVFELIKSQESGVQSQVSNTELLTPGTGRFRLNSKLINIEIIPGIPALSACAARLGAPLMHDFASISLSDLLTPWELIEKRLEAAASADFVIVIYNPKSKSRQDNIDKARDIIMRHRDGKTPVGIVKAATRDAESIIVTDLENMLSHEIGMQSTVIIGNSQTFIWDDRIITPRGYGKKYAI